MGRHRSAMLACSAGNAGLAIELGLLVGSSNLSGDIGQTKKGPVGTLFHLTGAPGEIRTPDLLVRSQTLYPTELRARFLIGSGSNPVFVASRVRTPGNPTLTMAEREGFEPSKGV